jgi:hypothetical protein
VKRILKERLKYLFSRLFVLSQRFGIDILPRHFYSEIPDIRKLKATEWWRREYSMYAVSSENLDKQVEFIKNLITPEVKAELADLDVHKVACEQNNCGGYGRIEADVLHGFVRTIRPQRIIQVGRGFDRDIP